MANLNLQLLKDSLELQKRVSIKTNELNNAMDVTRSYYIEFKDPRLNPYLDDPLQFKKAYLTILMGTKVTIEEKEDNITVISI